MALREQDLAILRRLVDSYGRALREFLRETTRFPCRVGALVYLEARGRHYVHDPDNLLVPVRAALDSRRAGEIAAFRGDRRSTMEQDRLLCGSAPIFIQTIDDASSSTGWIAWFSDFPPGLWHNRIVYNLMDRVTESLVADLETELLLEKHVELPAGVTATLGKRLPPSLDLFLMYAIAGALSANPGDGGNLQSVLHIVQQVRNASRAREEGKLPQGRILIFQKMQVDYRALMGDAPDFECWSGDQQIAFEAKLALDRNRHTAVLSNSKHLCKLLALVQGLPGRALIADQFHIYGVATDPRPQHAILAESDGVSMILSRVHEGSASRVCRFRNGLAEICDSGMDARTLLHILAASGAAADFHEGMPDVANALIDRALRSGHGCTLVIEPRGGAATQAALGHKLSHPADLLLESGQRLAGGMSAIDGALLIDGEMGLRQFGAILDGPALEDEDRSRGARFNSARRYSSAHPAPLIVIVSEDGLVSVFRAGAALSTIPNHWPIGSAWETLEDWLVQAERMASRAPGW